MGIRTDPAAGGKNRKGVEDFCFTQSNRNQNETLSYLSLQYKLLAMACIQAGINGNPVNIKEKEDKQATFSINGSPKVRHDM